MLYMNWEKSEYKPIIINDSTKSEYIKRTAALLENMSTGDYFTAFDRYSRAITIYRNHYGFAVYSDMEIISKRTAAKETARRLFELDVNNRIGY